MAHVLSELYAGLKAFNAFDLLGLGQLIVLGYSFALEGKCICPGGQMRKIKLRGEVARKHPGSGP